MFVQEQEEYDHGDGYTNEFQRQFAWNHIQANANGDIGSDPQIREEIAKGKWVAVYSYIVYCPSTDASMGQKTCFISSHNTSEEAQEAIAGKGSEDGDCSYEVKGPRVALPEDSTR